MPRHDKPHSISTHHICVRATNSSKARRLTALIDGHRGTDRAVLNTSFPSKDGMTAVTLALQAKNNVIDTDINWKIDRKRDYSGAVAMTTLVDRHNGHQHLH